MSLIESEFTEFVLILIGLTATIIFGFASKRHPSLLGWFFIVFLSEVGIISNFLSHYLEVFDLISDLSYTISIIIASYIIIKEYNGTFRNKTTIKSVSGILLFGVFMTYSLLLMAVILLLVNLTLQIRLALRKRSITYGFLCLTLFGALLTLLGNIFINLRVEGALAVNVGLDLFFTSMLVTTGIVALMEDKIRQSELKYKKSYERASFYKDLVSHDINNILQSIQLSTELISINIKKSNNLDKIEELSYLINEHVERGSKLVKNVRVLSEVEDLTYPLIDVELLGILKQSIEFVHNSSQSKKVVVDLNSKFNKIPVKANELLSDVFENILNNAVKHNNNHEIKILIVISKKAIDEIPFYKIEFKDKGNGVPLYLKKDIFLRAPSKKGTNNGMGLGLSLVKKIIDTYHGKIWVEENIKGDHSKGSNFILMIPEN